VRSQGRGARSTARPDPTPQILVECIALHTALVKAGLAAD